MDAAEFKQDVPIPPVRRWAKFAEMKVGDSYLGTKADEQRLWQYAKSRGWKIKSRKEPDGQRLWRIA